MVFFGWLCSLALIVVGLCVRNSGNRILDQVETTTCVLDATLQEYEKMGEKRKWDGLALVLLGSSVLVYLSSL